jgi:NADH-quinone oxidoreductase subunit K
MPEVGLASVLLFAAALFVVGLYGAISRKEAINILMSLEIMMIAISLNLMGLARFVPGVQVHAWFFTMFLMVIGAAEIGIGLALVVAIYRKVRTSEVDDLHELKG